MKLKIIVVCGICMMMCADAVAIIKQCQYNDCPINATYFGIGQNCAGMMYSECVGTKGVKNCMACATGYTFREIEYAVPECSIGANKLVLKTCVPECDGTCTDCVSGNWSTGTVYQSRTVATCDTSTCVCSKTTEYRCAAGYYGTSTNGTTGCTRCPELSGTYGSSSAGSTSITSCCLASGATAEDDNGTYTFTSSCCYTN